MAFVAFGCAFFYFEVLLIFVFIFLRFGCSEYCLQETLRLIYCFCNALSLK